MTKYKILSLFFVIFLLTGSFIGCNRDADLSENTGHKAKSMPGQGTMIFVVASPEHSEWGRFLALFYREAFKRLGIPFKLKHLPGKRATLMTDTETADGDLWRIPAYGKAHPNLVIVNSDVGIVTYGAYAKKRGIKLKGSWKGFKGTNYRVATRRGVMFSKMNLLPYINNKNYSAANTVTIGLRLLKKKRIDVYVGITRDVEAVLKTDEFNKSGIYKIKVLEQVRGYPYLLKKHKKLAPGLKKVIDQMKKEGLLEKYLKMAQRNDVIAQ